MNGPNVVHIPPREPLVAGEDLTILVRVPGDPTAVRAYTDAESEDAEQYAAEHGGEIISLPLTDGVWDWDTKMMRPSAGRHPDGED